MREYAEIHILKSPYHLDLPFDYFIPPHLRGCVCPGDFAVVPFGNGNKHEIGLVTLLKDAPENPNKECKPVISVCDSIMSLGSEAMGLCFFMKEQTLCTLGDAVRAMIPISALTRLKEYYRPAKDVGENEENIHIDASTLPICDFIRARGSVSFDLLKSSFGEDVRRQLKKLCDKKLIIRDFSLVSASDKTENVYSLAIEPRTCQRIINGEDSSVKLRSEAHRTVLAFLAEREGEDITEKDIILSCGVTKAQIRALCDKKLITGTEKKIDRSIIQSRPHAASPKEIVLNEEQSAAFDTLCRLADSGLPKAALLHGVTGSGKTSVMMRTIDHVLSKGKGVILLLPEIALTPQTLDIFCGRYGDRVAISIRGFPREKDLTPSRE